MIVSAIKKEIKEELKPQTEYLSLSTKLISPVKRPQRDYILKSPIKSCSIPVRR